jgi:hypothetical protein
MLDQPALDRYPEDGPPPGRPTSPRAPEVLVRFLDGTWRSCRVLQWVAQGQGDDELWWCLLRWGVLGQLYAVWYRHDEARMLAMKGSDQHKCPESPPLSIVVFYIPPIDFLHNAES